MGTTSSSSRANGRNTNSDSPEEVGSSNSNSNNRRSHRHSAYPGARRSTLTNDSASVISSASGNRAEGNTNAASSNNSSQVRGSGRTSSSGEPSVNAYHNNRRSGGPGAYLIEPVRSGMMGTVFRVSVPENVRAGQEFQVHAGNRVVRVRCPANARGGQFLQITVPADSAVCQLNPAQLTAAGGEGLPTNDALSSTNNDFTSPGVIIDGAPTVRGQSYLVPIPPVSAMNNNNQFPIFISGQQLLVTCPPNSHEGMMVRIYTPIPTGKSSVSPPPVPPSNQTQMFEVIVPPGVQPNQPFALLAGGQRVLVTCPSNAKPGQRIRFQLPMALLHPSENQSPPTPALSYEKHGWARTIRLSDLKFQWARIEVDQSIQMKTSFNPKTSAYVRQIRFYPGKDHRMRTGALSLIPASQAVVDSHVKDENTGENIISYSDLTQIQNKPFDEKITWFTNICRNKLLSPWRNGNVRICIRREFLLEDSIQAITSLSRKDMRRIWRFEFLDEPGLDAGGPAREWFELVTKEVFNPERGLWISSAYNQMCMQINPTSNVAAEEHLIYFRFLGRVLGKAILDQQLVSNHMVRYMYKHLLGWPITFDDMQFVDDEYFDQFMKLWDSSEEDISFMCLDFTTTVKSFGHNQNVDLIPNGSQKDVTKDNLPEYLEANFLYRFLGQVKPQLTELLLGFLDVVPEPILTIFDFQELELLMCGIPSIDVQDWKNNTEYSGLIRRKDQVVKWFWETVEFEFENEMKARLLQFATGTSGVPSRGFEFLQGSDGNLRKFTMHGVSLSTGIYPRAHTCFNRIDLPVYKSKEQLKQNLSLAIQLEATGFGLE